MQLKMVLRLTYCVEPDVFVLSVDVLDVMNDVVEDGFTQQLVLAAEESEEKLQHARRLDQPLVPQHD